MGITRSRIRNLEKRAKKQRRFQSESKPIPENWVDFARSCKIRSGGNVVSFNPYQYQIDLVDLMVKRSVCIVKSRQLGISETITCFMLWRACLNPGYLGLVFSKTQTDSSLLARRMKRMIESLGLKTVTENLSDIEIQGLGRILFRNSKPDSARGIESVVDCFLDELAFQENAKEIYDALAPAMQMVGDKARVFAVSTPNGKSGFFYDLASSNNGDKNIELLCEQASKGETKPFQHWVDSGGWAKVLIHWKSHPVYGNNLNFLEDIHVKQKLSWEIIEREYNLSFSDSSVAVFSSDLIRLNATGTYSDKPNKHTEYYCGLDTSSLGSDYTVFTVFEFKNNKLSLVHLYRKRHQTSEYHLYQISQIINKFNPQTIGVETNGVGSIYLENLTRDFRDLDFQGIRTSQDSKIQMISRMVLCLEKNQLLYPQNCPIIEEMLSFQRTGKKLEAASGKHDDIIMSTAFAIAVSPLAFERVGFNFDDLGDI
ncbi:MAG: terminase family protein [Cyanobacteria bacterium J06649_11]